MVTIVKEEPAFFLKLDLTELYFLKGTMQDSFPDDGDKERELRARFFRAVSDVIEEHHCG